MDQMSETKNETQTYYVNSLITFMWALRPHINVSEKDSSVRYFLVIIPTTWLKWFTTHKWWSPLHSWNHHFCRHAQYHLVGRLCDATRYTRSIYWQFHKEFHHSPYRQLENYHVDRTSINLTQHPPSLRDVDIWLLCTSFVQPQSHIVPLLLEPRVLKMECSSIWCEYCTNLH